MNRDRQASLALALSVVSFVVVPISYSWALSPGQNPPWLAPVIAVSEWGGLACAIAAIFISFRARVRGAQGLAATWAPRIALGTLVVYLVMLFVLLGLYR